VSDFFAYYGRVGRVRFVFYFVLSMGLMLTALALYTLLMPASDLEAHPILSDGAAAMILCGSLYFFYASFAKRLHDLNLSGAWALVMLPFFYISALVLACLPGEKEQNRFGEPPGSPGRLA